LTHLTREQIEELEGKLRSERQAIVRQRADNDHFGLDTPIRETLGDSSVDNHPADQGTETFERAKDVALNEHARFTLDRIERALSAMEKGNYGRCAVCGRPIPYERLQAVPWALHCAVHSEEQYVPLDRPAEEGVLVRPFGRTSLDEHEDTQFDGEDAWQIVERWGTSSSPAFAEQRQAEDYDELYVESEEPEGYVEPIESFAATDIYGKRTFVVRNDEYRKYMASAEGDRTLEPDLSWEDVKERDGAP